MELIHKIRERMMRERLMFVYRGVVTSDNSASLLMLLEKEMEDSQFGFLSRKRLFMFVLESLQNVSRHTERDSYADMSLVVYSKTENGYKVTTGNVIESSRIEFLSSRLDRINNLDPREIRTVYRQMLSTAELSSKGGAGIGLIEMAKTTGNRLDYDFIKIDDRFSYFILSKTVDSGGLGMHRKGRRPVFKGKTFGQLEKMMDENDIHIIWSGLFSPDVGKEVLYFTETKLSEEDVDSATRRKIFSILVESIDNVARHSPGSEPSQKYGMPVVMVRLEGRMYAITTGNLILNTGISSLKEKLDIINSCDKASLVNLFKDSLLKQDIRSESTGNMGLVEMARKSHSKLEYHFDNISRDYSYFTLTVRVEGF